MSNKARLRQDTQDAELLQTSFLGESLLGRTSTPTTVAKVAPKATVVTQKVAVAPAKTKAKNARWAKLAGREWGIRAGVQAKPGDIVTVQKANGETSRVKLGEKTSIAGVFRKAGAKKRLQCPGDNRCRTQGMQQGANCTPFGSRHRRRRRRRGW